MCRTRKCGMARKQPSATGILPPYDSPLVFMDASVAENSHQRKYG